MLISRLLLRGGYLKNGLACSVGRRITALQTYSCYNSTGSKKPGNAPLGLILPVYIDAKGNFELTKYGQDLDKLNSGKIKRRIAQLPGKYKLGEAFVVTDVIDKDKNTYWAVALSCCGHKDAKVNESEGLDEKKENLRCCIGKGNQILNSNLMNLDQRYEPDLDVDVIITANDGYYLREWTPAKSFSPFTGNGKVEQYARVNGQCWARHLSENPLNPKGVVKEVTCHLDSLGVKINTYDKIDHSMQAIIAVARGSKEDAILLECEFKGKKDAPLVLIVANGVTFDSGGLCLKKPENLLKREGMTGAAAALGAMFSLAALKAPVNVKLVVPLCENMISGECLRVGEVVSTKKGLDVKVEDTGLEGHLMLADALTYGQESKPKYIISVAALTPGIATATGGVCYGCFTHNEDLWKVARQAGIQTGDRPWRFPIWDSYAKLITGDTPVYNLKNRGSGMASHCTGAAFLDKFVTGDNWLHYDITGVGKMRPETAPLYLDPNYMTGRPTRALTEAILSLSNHKHHDGGICP